jgi:hypothetical protein
MTVLSILVLMAANIFQSSSAAWNIGTQKADMNTAARAALDFMVRELESAVAGPIDKTGSGGVQYLTFRQESLSELRFLSLANDPNSVGIKRAVRGVFFWCDFGENRIMMNWKDKTPSTLDCYDTSPGWDGARSGGGLLITNALSLQFYVYTNESDLASGTFAPNMTHYQLPICVDIALEILSNDDMHRYNQLSGAPQTEFKNRNAKLYSTRVYFPNRVGYGGR